MDEEATTQEQIKVSIFTPLIYVGVLLTCFIAFSIIYRRKKIKNLTKVEPIFGENHTASLYQFLKAQYTNPDATKETKPHEKVLKAALLRRAVEAIRRSLKLKENEPIFKYLYQEGLIGDEVFRQFEFQAKYQELELKEIVQETELYKKGWVQTFFPVAQEICFNEALRRRLNAMDGRSKSLSVLWEYYVDLSEGKSTTAGASTPITNSPTPLAAETSQESKPAESLSEPNSTDDNASSEKNTKKNNKKKNNKKK
ncbi:hypothetical protein HYPBUDRAFT_137740 [Hyphopichia burtonii NRRL Y-1933]|uniref:Translocation protein SEC66 n=1 Tax=Hyphopichia burtonii NRRL Y-1933 TaxID=984485 RepID=A0A1E4RKT8_9ASCO|nr:hypothetical protein HYPBUDRAFT_137740 [Hyphopichia burtonii NRRL Y-1933]ODV67888.1 hypothetical protein HYPBUDRAFT_137740 [Hyphopichia burtonii NRRL Y-1933]